MHDWHLIETEHVHTPCASAVCAHPQFLSRWFPSDAQFATAFSHSLLQFSSSCSKLIGLLAHTFRLPSLYPQSGDSHQNVYFGIPQKVSRQLTKNGFKAHTLYKKRKGQLTILFGTTTISMRKIREPIANCLEEACWVT